MVPGRCASALALSAWLGACAGPSAKTADARLDVRVCVSEERLVEEYAKVFKAAISTGPRGGRDCDVLISASALDAGKVTVRSAYDGSVLAELEVPVDLAPKLAAFSLAPGSEPYLKVTAQRDASGFR